MINRIHLQSADVKLAIIIIASQISMSCPSDSTSNEVDRVADVTVHGYSKMFEVSPLSKQEERSEFPHNDFLTLAPRRPSQPGPARLLSSGG